MGNNTSATSIEKLSKSRKVNKPRLSLRTKGNKEATLPRQYRGIIPMFMLLGVDFNKHAVDSLTPQEHMASLGVLLSEDSYRLLNKTQLTKLRSYLKRLGYADYTRSADEKSARTATTCKARR